MKTKSGFEFVLHSKAVGKNIYWTAKDPNGNLICSGDHPKINNISSSKAALAATKEAVDKKAK